MTALFLSRQRGFTLIELMVGLVVGLLTTLLITNIMVAAESQRRTSGSGNSAQVSAAGALYGLQHELQMAGYGLTVNPSALGCTVKAQGSGSAFTMTLAPVVITQGASGAPDTVTILSGNKSGALIPVLVTETHPTNATSFVVQSSFSVSTGDTMIATPAAWDAANTCTVFTVTGTSATSVDHAASGNWNSNQALLFPAAGYASGSALMNMGTLYQRTYSVADASTNTLALQTNTRNATTGAMDSTTVRDTYPDIVNLKALYGLDTTVPPDGKIDIYTATTPTTNAVWQQVIGLRVAIVARSSEREKEKATDDGTKPVWKVRTTMTDSALSTVPIAIPNPAGAAADEWMYYRYKLYDTVVPLRNALWRDQ